MTDIGSVFLPQLMSTVIFVQADRIFWNRACLEWLNIWAKLKLVTSVVTSNRAGAWRVLLLGAHDDDSSLVSLRFQELARSSGIAELCFFDIRLLGTDSDAGREVIRFDFGELGFGLLACRDRPRAARMEAAAARRIDR